MQNQQPKAVRAFYFDGKTSRKYDVELKVEAGIASISGDVQRQAPLDALRVSERSSSASRKVTFADGAYLEIIDLDAFAELLANTGYTDSPIVRLQQSWRAVLQATAALIVILALGYAYLLPAASGWIANALPEAVERKIGGGTLDFLDNRVFSPTTLPQSQQDALISRFRALEPPRQGAPEFQIIFRKSKIGPNAFALPSGDIVVTDELVRLLDDDDAMMGVLAHELGHLHERHMMRRLIQVSAVGVTTTLLFGDVSALVASIPPVILDLKYSRDIEREADDYAIAMFKANGISLTKLARTFEKLDSQPAAFSPYLSSHPPSKERIARILKAQTE
ncbi:Putative heat shock protein [Collimonas arenae]|uniref:Putative heat shock protein n=1 Tax=Collimonas arenae TaxID=279058 RepID=A0A0A1FFD7_9BURK|nr:M48 family metallopeptidase [Collimonas arenae]AIY42490.1 Putative heat shock protein [Collimonas arenae]